MIKAMKRGMANPTFWTNFAIEVENKIGMMPIAERLWSINYGFYRLGYFDGIREQIIDRLEIKNGPKRAEKVSPMCPDQSVTHVPG